MKSLNYLLLFVAHLCAGKLSFQNIPLEPPNDGKLWAVLVAGSYRLENYRHQADVCHAYQILHAHGIPDEQIVVMMADDIAHNPGNVYPGKIYNSPWGSDVYKGVPKDYTHITHNNTGVQQFLTVLEGKHWENNSSLKTVASGPDDHVFVFFADHGAPGILGFGNDNLKATDLIDTIKRKHANKGFKKMVFYVEACESGSMFKNLLPEDINVYATTAANSTTSSYACYFDEGLQTYLGDVYSVKWMEDSDREDLEKETLLSQYDIVKEETNTSQVCEFGDLSIGNDKVGSFQGWKEPEVKPVKVKRNDDTCGRDAVPAGEVKKSILERKLKAAKGTLGEEQAQKELDEHLQYRQQMERKVRSIIDTVTGHDFEQSELALASVPEINDYDCYYDAVDAFHAHCYNLGAHDYAMRQIFSFANLCKMKYPPGKIIQSILDHCMPLPIIDVQ